jgi:hypothetical protein
MTRKRPLGCLTVPGIIIGVLVILIVIAIGLVFGGRLFNPGALNAQAGVLVGGVTSHAALSGKCSSCHAYFWQSATMADRCLACHTEVAVQLNDPTTLHGNQAKKRPGLTCRDCHPDHRGPIASLVDLSKADLSHDAFGFSLNAHQKQADGSPFTCRTCHVGGYMSFDRSVCLTCHQQLEPDLMPAHLQAYGQDCLGCHDGVDTYGHNFSHDTAAFKLTGKHAQVDCYSCHSGARSIGDLKATSQDCGYCHAKDDAHQGQLGTDCGACHTPDGWTPASFDHAKSKFPLTGAHATLQCTQCHLNNVFTALDIACYSCHAKDDTHNGQFGTQCDTCHTTTAWLPASFDHATSGFPLTGAHASLACSQCHLNNVFTALDTACYACHAKDDAHNGQFGTDCGQCHTTTAWLPATFDHAKTGFPLTGAHSGLACSKCHTGGVFTGLSASCAACHAEPAFHTGLFTNMSCDQCHTTSAWSPAQFNAAHPNACGEVTCIDHERATCRDCHNVDLMTATCLKCHSSNNPGGDGGDGGD